MKRNLFLALIILCLLPELALAMANDKKVIYLSGSGAYNTATWDFFCTGGRKSGYWTKIEVPSCWEQQGFGTYEYGRNGYSYGPKYKYADEKGLYRKTFMASPEWKGKVVKLVFEGSMTETEVKINGKPAGEIHKGSFYRFSYDITDKIRLGEENTLEVTVSKLSTDESVNRAERYGDYWNFGGIFRPVYLEIYPAEHVTGFSISASADGKFVMNIFPKTLKPGRTIHYEITSPDGRIVAASSIGIQQNDTVVTTSCKVTDPIQWTSETPVLYTLRMELRDGKKTIYNVSSKFGFRTIEVRHGDGIYVNGVKVRMKGVNRHSFWPETGRTLNREICLNDVKLIKEMNMNAVRMSHYPPDEVFLDLCDSLGLYVLDELAGWQRAYDTPVGKKLVKEMVTRDRNHPSVLFWVNGNEGGTNKELDREFTRYDLSGRDVIHAHHRPGNAFNGIDCNHYETYQSASTILKDSLIYMPTEFLHAQDDGGGAAGLADYWELLWTSERSGGGFIWAMLDEGLSRTDLNGFIDTDGVNAPDGLLGPHREKEGSFFAIREIYSPVHITLKELPEHFDGKIEAENRFHFTNFDKCTFTGKLVNYARPYSKQAGYETTSTFKISSPSVSPGKKGIIDLGSIQNLTGNDALVLTATDPFGNEIYTWTWKIRKNKEILGDIIKLVGEKETESSATDSTITLKANGTSVVFSKITGYISRITYNNRTNLGFGKGPVFTRAAGKVISVEEHQEKDCRVVTFNREGELGKTTWKMYSSGWLSLDYEYGLDGEYQYAGISFSYPENWTIRATWLGNGPYRVWKNRLQGVNPNVWEKVNNNIQTGATPVYYPEFKGYFSGLTWLELGTAQGKVFIGSEDEGLYLRLFDFHGITGPISYPLLPAGDISILDCIPPVGSKLATGLTTDASVYGPAGKLTKMNGLIKHRLWFYFGIPDQK
ncbi:MAG: glycoside hydrolase family 2 TIM barrel-domain containing protein [Bacteroidales bacterium]